MKRHVIDGPMSQPAPQIASNLFKYMTRRQLGQLDIRMPPDPKQVFPSLHHDFCKAKTGVCRPGKTARDKQRGVHKSKHDFHVTRDAHTVAR